MAALGIIVLVVVYLGFSVFVLASMWKVLAKAGQPGWAIFIPIYNIYVLMKVAGMSGWWLLACFVPILNILVAILMVAGIARNFGKGGGFAAGLFFLPFIFYPILAFGDAVYLGEGHPPESSSARVRY